MESASEEDETPHAQAHAPAPAAPMRVGPVPKKRARAPSPTLEELEAAEAAEKAAAASAASLVPPPHYDDMVLPHIDDFGPGLDAGTPVTREAHSSIVELNTSHDAIEGTSEQSDDDDEDTPAENEPAQVDEAECHVDPIVSQPNVFVRASKIKNKGGGEMFYTFPSFLEFNKFGVIRAAFAGDEAEPGGFGRAVAINTVLLCTGNSSGKAGETAFFLDAIKNEEKALEFASNIVQVQTTGAAPGDTRRVCCYLRVCAEAPLAEKPASAIGSFNVLDRKRRDENAIFLVVLEKSVVLSVAEYASARSKLTKPILNAIGLTESGTTHKPIKGGSERKRSGPITPTYVRIEPDFSLDPNFAFKALEETKKPIKKPTGGKQRTLTMAPPEHAAADAAADSEASGEVSLALALPSAASRAKKRKITKPPAAPAALAAPAAPAAPTALADEMRLSHIYEVGIAGDHWIFFERDGKKFAAKVG